MEKIAKFLHVKRRQKLTTLILVSQPYLWRQRWDVSWGCVILRDWREEAELWDSFTSALVGHLRQTPVWRPQQLLYSFFVWSLVTFGFEPCTTTLSLSGTRGLILLMTLVLTTLMGMLMREAHKPRFNLYGGKKIIGEIDFEVGSSFPMLKSHSSSEMRRHILVISCSQSSECFRLCNKSNTISSPPWRSEMWGFWVEEQMLYKWDICNNCSTAAIHTK